MGQPHQQLPGVRCSPRALPSIAERGLLSANAHRMATRVLQAGGTPSEGSDLQSLSAAFAQTHTEHFTKAEVSETSDEHVHPAVQSLRRGENPKPNSHILVTHALFGKY